jgi:tRNA G18 (ribose-2'-O)-methylase SpoU
VLDIHSEYSAEDVSDFHSLRGKSGHLDRGLFIAESPKVVEHVLESRMRVHAAFVTPEHFEKYRAAFEARPEVVRVFIAQKPEMESVVGYALHQGLMMTVAIPPSGDLFAEALPEKWLGVALDSIADAENMGAIIRNCAAFGVTSILLDDRSCNPYLRRSVRVSIGTVADMTFYRMPHLSLALERLRDTVGVTVVGASLGEGAQPLASATHHARTVLVFGSEGWGVRESVRRACSELREIAMSNEVDSLNVAISNGIFLYEYTRLGAA